MNGRSWSDFPSPSIHFQDGGDLGSQPLITFLPSLADLLIHNVGLGVCFPASAPIGFTSRDDAEGSRGSRRSHISPLTRAPKRSRSRT